MSAVPENAFGPNFPLDDPDAVAAMLGIKSTDRVLEIGGAANPFLRANVVCDITFGSSAQRNGAPTVLREDVTYVESSVEHLPFADGEFDFVYCTQVLEHVRDPAAAAREISRVARRGFIEVPSRLGELVNGNPTHRWIVDREGETLVFSPREFLDHPFQNFFYGVILANPELRALAEVEFRNALNHQVLFESPLQLLIKAPSASSFDYDDPDQAGRAHYGFARNVLRAGGDPAYTLPDAQEAVRLLPDSACARILHAVHLARLNCPEEAIAALGSVAVPAARALKDELFADPSSCTLPIPPPDPYGLGAESGTPLQARPLVTVVVAGRDATLCRQSAESALTQDYPMVEVLVAAATDESSLTAACSKLDMGDRLRLIPLGEDTTVGACFNKAGISARGELVAFLLEGDRYQAGHVDRLVSQLIAADVPAVHGDWFDATSGKIFGPDILPDDPRTAGASVSTLLARRIWLEAFGGFQEEAGDEAPLRLLVGLAQKQPLLHLREATVASARPIPEGIPALQAVQSAGRFNPQDLLRSLMASCAREAGLRARIQELEKRLEGPPRAEDSE